MNAFKKMSTDLDGDLLNFSILRTWFCLQLTADIVRFPASTCMNMQHSLLRRQCWDMHTSIDTGILNMPVICLSFISWQCYSHYCFVTTEKLPCKYLLYSLTSFTSFWKSCSNCLLSLYYHHLLLLLLFLLTPNNSYHFCHYQLLKLLLSLQLLLLFLSLPIAIADFFAILPIQLLFLLKTTTIAIADFCHFAFSFVFDCCYTTHHHL